jgi:hypothetical protein
MAYAMQHHGIVFACLAMLYWQRPKRRIDAPDRSPGSTPRIDAPDRRAGSKRRIEAPDRSAGSKPRRRQSNRDRTK